LAGIKKDPLLDVIGNRLNHRKFLTLSLFHFHCLNDLELPNSTPIQSVVFLTKELFDEPASFQKEETLTLPIGELRFLINHSISVGFLFSFPKYANIEVTSAYIKVVRKKLPFYRSVKTVLETNDIMVMASGISSMLVLNKHNTV
jgi:hypothetical protein